MRGPLPLAAATGCWLGLIALLAGCSDSSAPAPKATVSSPVDPSTAGTIRIEVRYEGPLPAPQELNMRSAAQCAAAHAGPVHDESLAVHDGQLANAVAWVKEGLEDRVFAPPAEPVVVNQKGCVYTPHVAAAMVNQPVRFVNSDPEAHNVHGHPEVVRAWNFMISRQGSSRTLTFDKPEIAIPVGCDIHPWMRAYLAVVAHPYFGVTPASGSVTLTQVPPGAYTIAVWHEQLGTKEQRVALEPSSAATLRFTYEAGDR